MTYKKIMFNLQLLSTYYVTTSWGDSLCFYCDEPGRVPKGLSVTCAEGKISMSTDAWKAAKRQNDVIHEFVKNTFAKSD